ncbi:MAG: hypothetical protein KIS92_06280 [Planctomycetota bacterium]|nr:hypothetical protein [Planctomycetota bacterium]
MQTARFTTLVLSFVLAAGCARAGDEDEMRWVDATGNLGGSEWTGNAGPWKVVCPPNSGDVICSMVGLGLWASSDGGATWARLGQEGSRPPNKGQAVQFVFDPKNPKNFWTSGMYGYGVWKTTDGGKTLVKLGTNEHCDGIGVDLGDPEYKTLLLGLHEQKRSTHQSTDAGKTWTKIGDRLPENSNHSSDPIVLDAKTYLTNTSGWLKEHAWGIYRSEDAGATWTKVSDFGAAGNHLRASDGAIYWPMLWDGQNCVSTDRGKTWTKLNAPARGLFVEAPGGRIVGVKNTQLCFSTDQGKTWTNCGPALPFKPFGIAWSDARRCFFAFRQTKGKTAEAVVRWDLPQDLAKGFAPFVSSTLGVWNGEGFSGGNGWMNGGKDGYLKAQKAEKKSGDTALEFRFDGVEKGEGGWNWHNWALNDLTDIGGYKTLCFAAKVAGAAKPSELSVTLVCGPSKVSTKAVPLAAHCKEIQDGQWHEVAVPLKALLDGAEGFNPKATYEIRIQAAGAGLNCSVFVDDVRFSTK